MSKAEEKRKAAKARRDFITTAAQIVMNVVISYIADSQKQLTVKLTAKTLNRYISLHRYGEELQVKLYRSGDFDVTLKEFCHGDITIRLVEYEQAAPDPETALQHFKEDISLLLEDYLIHGCWHELMDYMWWNTQKDGSLDWRAAEKDYRMEFYNFEQSEQSDTEPTKTEVV